MPDVNRVYQLEFDGPTACLKGSSHNQLETDWTFSLDNENFDIQGLGRVAMYLNRRGEEIVSVMRADVGRTTDDPRYIIVTRTIPEPIMAAVPESPGQAAMRKAREVMVKAKEVTDFPHTDCLKATKEG